MAPRISLISPTQLAALPKTVSIIDASWHMPGSPVSGLENYIKERIPRARFFDLDEVASSHPLGLKHMLPSSELFARAVSRLGISSENPLVLYDTAGMFSAPRAAFTFSTFGHPNVSVLQGGLPRWKAEGFELEHGQPSPFKPENYPTPESVTPNATLPYEFIVSNSLRATSSSDSSSSSLVLDARAHPRFTGEAPEPRPGLPSGHIPGSKSLPFSELVKEGRLLEDEELKHKLNEVFGKDADAVFAGKKPVIASCGSGMTAATIWLALNRLGVESSIYDESWTGYAQRTESKIATGED
ncbi:Rhodanese-like domain-containing protein [Mrakia frigida]|uniref:thiosulfate sulfurtransferase n=1 Tax=Mrakia frigida TaxID=29902 RepID=UPI003FCBEE8E